MADPNEFKVKLYSPRTKNKVILHTSPTINEAKSVTYATLNPVHMPGSYYVYENSPGRKFDVSEFTLASRNQKEARENLQIINTLRGWTMPYFGSSDAPSAVLYENTVKNELKDWMGAPPEVLRFSAYSSSSARGNIYDLPVVIDSLSIQYPNTVDYIPTASYGNGDALGEVPFPILMTVGISLLEQHSAQEFEKFNLIEYRNGILPSF